MPQRVAPVTGDDHGERNEVYGHDATEQYGRGKEIRTDIAKQISETYGPILSAMKLAGNSLAKLPLPTMQIEEGFTFRATSALWLCWVSGCLLSLQ